MSDERQVTVFCFPRVFLLQVASRQDVGGAREPQSNFANNWRQRTSSELTRGEAPAHAAESEGSKGGPAPPHRSLSLSAMQQAQRASLAVGSPSYGGAYGACPRRK